ncbi:MAG TPA: EVE domain-containing protein [Nannocystis sp.]
MPKAQGRSYWLLKSEPEVYAIGDLERDGRAPWEGVRNYTARNFMRDQMKIGDLAIFYHSNADPPGAAGVARIASAAYPDPTQFDPKSPYFDPKAKPEVPRWFLVDVAFVERFPEFVPLATLKADRALKDMLVVQKGQRLSVQPVAPKHFARVLALGGSRLAGEVKA